MESIAKTSEFVCRYCERSFRRESTLSVHLCEAKRRSQQEHDPEVKLGFQTYLRFYELTQGSAKLKTYADFASSPYYLAFVKFGRHIRAINVLVPSKFIDFVIKQNKKLDHWCHDSVYEEYLLQHTRHEAVQDALARTIELAQTWAEENNSAFNHVFLYGNSNRICYQITQGRITAWALFNCKSGQAFLDKLNEEQTSIVYKWIDPTYWQKRFVDYPADTAWAQHMLAEAGF
jgi:hypothetical protein